MTLEQWERRTEWPLAAAAVIFLVAYSWIVLDPHMASALRRFLTVVDLITWLMFLGDYVVRVGLAKQRLSYVLHHLLDLVIVLLPVFRPLRLLRLVALLRVLDRTTTRSLQGRAALYIGVSAGLLVYAGALAELAAERGQPGSNIETFGTSLWWAITTVTTVGYGDHYPVTTTGRLVAAALMIGGVALIGGVTASLASWFVARVGASPTDSAAAADHATAGELARLRDEITALTAQLSERREAGPPPATG